MKHKRLNRDGWGFQHYPYYQMRIDHELFHGTACMIRLTDGEENYWETPKSRTDTGDRNGHDMAGADPGMAPAGSSRSNISPTDPTMHSANSIRHPQIRATSLPYGTSM